jgi:hypothetical protein
VSADIRDARPSPAEAAERVWWGADATYAYQPRLGGPGTRVTLTGDALAYAIGPREGRLSLRDVAGVRLRFHPAKFAHSSFETEIRTWGGEKVKLGSTSRTSITGVKDQGAEYAAFVRALHERLANLETAGGFRGQPPVVYRGGFSALRWWLVAVLGFATLAGLVAIFGIALIDRQWSFAAFLAVVSAFVAWPTVEMIARNRPVRYTARALPERLLPG